jgi:hypothetical protein
MIDLGIIFSVVIGGVLTLLGTLLANFLQYRSEERKLRKEQAKERFREVRRYLTACLDFVDLISIPTTMGPDHFGQHEMREWIRLVSEHFDSLKSLPVNGSARVLFVEDEEVLQGLKQIDELRLLFYLNYQGLIKNGQMIPYDDKREELKKLSVRVGVRLDELLDKI